MFPIRMRKLDNIYVRQTIRGLFGDILSLNIKLGLYENLAKTFYETYESFGLRN